MSTTIPAQLVKVGTELAQRGRVSSAYTENGTTYLVVGQLYVPVRLPAGQLVKVRPSA